MSTEEKLLLLRWRQHLNQMAPSVTSREKMLSYALAWLRGAMTYAPIKTYSQSFLKAIIEMVRVLNTWEYFSH